MEEIHIYIAKDGQRFDDSDECMAHEFDLDMAEITKDAEFWNQNEIPFTPKMNDLEDIYFMRFDTDEAAQKWSELYDEAGLGNPKLDTAGFYWFDLNSELCSFTDEMNQLLEMKEYFKIRD